MTQGKKEYSNYNKLLRLLHNIEFTWIIDLDSARASDGVEMRLRYCNETGCKRSSLGYDECTVLEMMVALAVRIEDQIMQDIEYGDRTYKWFWLMIESMGLMDETDDSFHPDYAENRVINVLDRQYPKDGYGGWVYIPGTKNDLRNATIWYQMMWYLDAFE